MNWILSPHPLRGAQRAESAELSAECRAVVKFDVQSKRVSETMTVAELIAELEKVPRDLEVAIQENEADEASHIEQVELVDNARNFVCISYDAQDEMINVDAE